MKNCNHSTVTLHGKCGECGEQMGISAIGHEKDGSCCRKNWQTEIGNLVKETYKQQGYSDVLVMIGAIAPDDNIHTQVWYPGDTDNDFDIRLMVFALNNHLFSEYNSIEDETEED